MGIIEIKEDIQEAVIHNVRNYYGDYGPIIFTETDKEYTQCFDYMEEFKVSLKDNKLLYNITLYEEALKVLRKSEGFEELVRNFEENKAKTAIVKNLVKNLEEKDLIATILPANNGKKLTNKNYDGYDINNMQVIQKIIKHFFNLDTTLKKGKFYLSLEVVIPEINFNKQQIIALSSIIKLADIFCLDLNYVDKENIENEQANGIRLFFANSLAIREDD